jgi:hypothetical protein
MPRLQPLGLLYYPVPPCFSSSHCRSQMLPRPTRRESSKQREVELNGRESSREFCLNADFHVTFMDLLRAANLRHGTDGFTSPTKEGVLRIFSRLKIWRLRPGLNARTWVLKASTLPLDHRSRYELIINYLDFTARLMLVFIRYIDVFRRCLEPKLGFANLDVIFASRVNSLFSPRE